MRRWLLADRQHCVIPRVHDYFVRLEPGSTFVIVPPRLPEVAALSWGVPIPESVHTPRANGQPMPVGPLAARYSARFCLFQRDHGQIGPGPGSGSDRLHQRNWHSRAFLPAQALVQHPAMYVLSAAELAPIPTLGTGRPQPAIPGRLAVARRLRKTTVEPCRRIVALITP